MSVKTPEQSPNTNNTFGDLLYQYMKLRKKTQKVLAVETGLSRATIGRMIANTDNRGGRYRTTEEAVVKICMALDLGLEKSKILYDAAFPERKIWWKCIANRQPIAAADMELEEAGLPTLFDSDAS